MSLKHTRIINQTSFERILQVVPNYERPPSNAAHNELLTHGSYCSECGNTYVSNFFTHSRMLDHFQTYECAFAKIVKPLHEQGYLPIYDAWIQSLCLHVIKTTMYRCAAFTGKNGSHTGIMRVIAQDPFHNHYKLFNPDTGTLFDQTFPGVYAADWGPKWIVYYGNLVHNMPDRREYQVLSESCLDLLRYMNETPDEQSAFTYLYESQSDFKERPKLLDYLRGLYDYCAQNK